MRFPAAGIPFGNSTSIHEEVTGKAYAKTARAASLTAQKVFDELVTKYAAPDGEAKK